MENQLTCPRCHIEVRTSDYYCYNCGSNLHPKPPSIAFQDQVVVYLKSFFLPPLGITVGLKYLKENDVKSKTVGILAIGLTVVSLILVVKATVGLVKMFNSGLENQLQLQGL